MHSSQMTERTICELSRGTVMLLLCVLPRGDCANTQHTSVQFQEWIISTDTFSQVVFFLYESMSNEHFIFSNIC